MGFVSKYEKIKTICVNWIFIQLKPSSAEYWIGVLSPKIWRYGGIKYFWQNNFIKNVIGLLMCANLSRCLNLKVQSHGAIPIGTMVHFELEIISPPKLETIMIYKYIFLGKFLKNVTKFIRISNIGRYLCMGPIPKRRPIYTMFRHRS